MEVWSRTKVTAICVTHDVDEAILLADRVVMMTNGPRARIGKIMNVDLPRPRTRKNLLEHPDYYAYRNELLTFLEELVHLRLMLTTTSIWSGLQGQESFLGSEQTLGQLSREINQAMELLTEALLNRRRGLVLIHSGKPQRKDAPIVSMLFDLSIPQSRGSIAMA